MFGTDDTESPCFFMEKHMEKSEKNKAKDRARIGNREWEHIPATYDRRRTASGVTFEGRYVPKKS